MFPDCGVLSFNQVNPNPSEATWTTINGRWCIQYENGQRVLLLHSKHKVHSMQDFGMEIRPFQDVNHFATEAVVLLDALETDSDKIMDTMLNKLVHEKHLKHSDLKVARASLMVNNEDSSELFSNTIRGYHSRNGGTMEFDQSWICIMGEVVGLEKRCVAIARLQTKVNLAESSCGVRFVILVLCPSKEKGTKNALETGLTFATMFADTNVRHLLLEVNNEEAFGRVLREQGKSLSEQLQKGCLSDVVTGDGHLPSDTHTTQNNHSTTKVFTFMKGIKDDVTRRLTFYSSDFTDGIRGPKTVQKVISTICFLYFACLLPNIAFGSLNDNNTNGQLNVQKVILGQALGGIFFAFVGGQPLLILMTTAPLALYTKTVYDISRDLNLDFFAFFGCVGLWNSFFLICYAVFDVSKIMKWCTRSSEEIFALFITIAFFVDAFTHVEEDFEQNYYTSACTNGTVEVFYPLSKEGGRNGTYGPPMVASFGQLNNMGKCNRASSILYLFLMLVTLWLGLFLYNFNKTQFLQARKRELVSDYSLPIAVLFVSFLGSYVFRDVKLKQFPYVESSLFNLAPLHTLPLGAVFGAMGLGFCLSLLFFMDQNISASILNNPSNRLKKGSAYHFDLLVVAILNGILSILSLPWMHAAIPHCPLHARCLADVEERIEHGTARHVIVSVRETRITALVSHVLIGLSLFLLPVPLVYIPNAVLDGLFLYMAITGLFGNQLFDRILLFATEQVSYPPNEYVRRVPQRKVHLFTSCQMLQLFLLCLCGFFPWVYLQLAFPVVLFLLLPIRYFIIPRILSHNFLQSLDGEHQ